MYDPVDGKAHLSDEKILSQENRLKFGIFEACSAVSFQFRRILYRISFVARVSYKENTNAQTFLKLKIQSIILYLTSRWLI